MSEGIIKQITTPIKSVAPLTQTEMSIGQLAAATGETVKTLRFWSDVGLLPAQRNENQYRMFDVNSQHRVPTIRNAQQMGFTLEEIHALLRACGEAESHDCRGVQTQLEHQLDRVREKMVTLQRFESELLLRLEGARKNPDPTCDSARGCGHLSPEGATN